MIGDFFISTVFELVICSNRSNLVIVEVSGFVHGPDCEYVLSASLYCVGVDSIGGIGKNQLTRILTGGCGGFCSYPI